MLIKNYTKIKQNTAEISKKNSIGIALKNNAYGFGLGNVVKAVDEYVSFYAVIDIIEAIKLRKLTNKKILLLEFSSLISEIKAYELTPTAKNYNEASLYSKCEVKYEAIIDIGMNRFGFREIDNSILGDKFLEGVYLHMPYNSIFLLSKLEKTANQIQKFDLSFHVGGSLLINHTSYPLRVGFAIYSNSLSLYGRVVDIRVINKGDRIGYDGAYVATHTHTYAILDVGYKDGIAMHYKGFVIKNGIKYPIIGKVCMNNMFIAIDDKISIGDYMEVFGDKVSFTSFSRACKMSEYECFLSINK